MDTQNSHNKRHSTESERTHVPSGENSSDQLGNMKEQEFRKHSHPDFEILDETPGAFHIHFDADHAAIPTSNDDGEPSASNDRDIEKGDEKKEDAEKDKARDLNLVDWDGPNDPGNPLNWSRRRRWIYTIALGTMTWTITFASSVFSAATEATAVEFGVSQEVMILGTSLFVLGFAIGPSVWGMLSPLLQLIFLSISDFYHTGPFSELFGRKIPLFTGFFIFALFNIPVAVAQNLQTIFLMRFFGGMFGCSPLAIIGGALADMWDPVDRGVAICVFAGAT